ncbi:twin-arginine translocation signal domain-containing protein, partial [Candidatus Woesearchaeota archaeon]|nr:twin-arginine translocation signal domain-containing protein [Candidatus Woesearchaeota archaeon]
MTILTRRGFLRMAAKGAAGAAVVGIPTGCAPETRASLDDLADLARSVDMGGALVTYPAVCWNGALLKRGRIEQEIQMHKNMVALSNEFERPRYKRRLEELTKELEATPISELSKGDKEDFDKVK